MSKVVRNDVPMLKELKRKLGIVSERYATGVKRRIRKDHFFKGGHLRSVIPLARGSGGFANADSFLVAGVQSNKRQALISEDGRRPNKKKPPATPLAQRLVKKAGFPGTVTGKFSDQPGITRKVALDMAERIGKEGIPGKKLYSSTALDMRGILNRLFAKA